MLTIYLGQKTLLIVVKTLKIVWCLIKDRFSRLKKCLWKKLNLGLLNRLKNIPRSGGNKMGIKRGFAIILIGLLILTTGCAGGGGKQEAPKFPTKALDMTILFGAGGGADVIARKLGDLASREIGQPIVANNRVGGGGAVGYQYVLNTSPDGHNIVWNSTSISTTYHQGNLPENKGYDAFRGVAKITDEASALSVKADAKWKTIEEFIAHAKANPGKVTVANSGVGSFNHLTAALIEQAAGVEFKHVPMDAKQSTTSLLGGKVDAMVNMVFDTVQQEKAGTIRALGVVADARQESLPDVPTFKEKGIDVDLTMYRGIAVPKETPDDVVKKLEDAFIKAGQDEGFKDFAKQYGVSVNILGAKEFDIYMKEQDALVAKAMELIGMKKQ